MSIGNDFIALGQYLNERPEVAEEITAKQFSVYVSDLKELAKHIGACEKISRDSYFSLLKTFGSVWVEFFTMRENVCERVKVGEKEIPEQVIPAEPAKPEQIVAAHTEPIYEWKCPESILAGE
jgi:hypothetical protein